MDTQGILIATLGGGIGGGLGALIGFGIGRLLPQNWRRGAETICAVALAVVGARLAPMIAGPSEGRDAISIEQQLLRDEALGGMAAAWQTNEPASFSAFTARLGAAAATTDRATLIEQARTELVAAARPRLQYLSDGDLVKLIRLARDQMLELKTSHPVACHPLFHGRRFGDISPYLSADLRAREIALLTAAFEADAATPRTTLSGDALNAAIDRVVTATRTQFGEDIALIAPDAQVEDKEPRVCEAAAAIFDQIQRLPEAEAAGVMRGLTQLTQ